MKVTLKERFDSKVQRTEGCWLWIAALHGKGYGHMRVAGKVEKAHRVSYEIFNGPIPYGMMVLHTCDNPRCVNPDHLFLGTNKDNMADMAAKGRGNAPRGEEQHLARLTEAAVQSIRASRKPGIALARDFGISPQTVCDVRKRKTWKHI